MTEQQGGTDVGAEERAGIKPAQAESVRVRHQGGDVLVEFLNEHAEVFAFIELSAQSAHIFEAGIMRAKEVAAGLCQSYQLH